MIKDILRPWKLCATALPWKTAAACGLYKGQGAPVQFVTERQAWAIQIVGEHIRDEINALHPGRVDTTFNPEKIANRVIHFGSQYMWLNWGPHMPRGNRYVTSFFHGKPEDGPDIATHINQFLDSVPKLDMIITGASLIEDRLLSWGVPRDKVVRIPIGVDTKAFTPPTAAQRTAARAKYNIADDRIVIGSFQKDGQGWGDGMEPKMIKGPDQYVAAIAEVAKHYPVTAFLTGPARGYVKQELDKRGIPFIHTYAEEHTGLVECYHCLDMYFMTSREEGGPMGVMESMASGVPVVASAVGMAPDLIEDGVTGGLLPPENPTAIAERACELLARDDDAKLALRDAALEAVQITDWSVVGRDHWEKAYKPLIG